MIKSKTTIGRAGLAFVVATLAAPVFAGGMAAPVIEPVVAVPAPAAVLDGNWTGAYVGADLGGARSTQGGNSHNGSVYGLRGGYDLDLGQWVVGGALGWDKTNLGLGTGSDRLNSIARLSARVGRDLGPTLVYATAGVARATADIGGAKLHDTGWSAGIGADYRLNDRWTIGGEVLTNRFSKFGGSALDVNATTASVNLGLRF